MSLSAARTDAIAAAWASVRFILGVLINGWGAPSELLALRLLPRYWRRDFLAWVRPAEQLVRRLLLIRAAELAQSIALPTHAPRARRANSVLRPRPPRTTPQEQSAQWRSVRFSPLLPPRRALSGKRWPTRRADGFSTRLPVARPFAERLEALIRIVENPEPTARRLARRLLRLNPAAEPYSRDDLIGRLLRPTLDHPDNPARLSMKRLEPFTHQASERFSSA